MAQIHVADDVVNTLGGEQTFTRWLYDTINEEIDKRAGRLLRDLPRAVAPDPALEVAVGEVVPPEQGPQDPQ